MSLADELIADFDEDSQETPESAEKVSSSIPVAENTHAKEYDGKKSVFFIARLMSNPESKTVLDQISNSNIAHISSLSNITSGHPEYDLVVKSNKLLADLDTEINIVFKFLKDFYNKRFPELESLVTNAAEYIQTVSYLGNEMDPVKLEKIDFLPPAIKMVVTVTASTTIGEKLMEEDMVYVEEACQHFFELIDYKFKIMDFIQSRMSFIAPNLCRIIGPNTAAEIMGAAGGLNALQQMPACNILLLGAQRRTLVGFSSANVLPHTGFIYFSTIVQKVPPQFRKKAARVVSAKIALAVRVDNNREFSDGSFGDKMLVEIEKKYNKWLAPPPVKLVKALPVPDDKPRKKRGGRRQRHMKQKLALTELRKQANRVHFGRIQEDIYQDSIGFGLNALTQSGSGNVRTAVIDSKTKISISKRLQKNLASMNNTFGTKTSIRSNVSGLASSVAFTPMQGLEIINPNINDKNKAPTNDSLKYFSHKSGFQSSKHIE